MKIISTINNKKLNNKLEEKMNLIYEDNDEQILYLIKNDKKINNILLTENIIKKYIFEEFINKILKLNKKIKIFIIFENKINNINKINFLTNKKNINYYFNDEIIIEELLLNIFDFNKRKSLIINKIKEKTYKIKNIKFNIKFLNKINFKENNVNNQVKCKVISICGYSRSRKNNVYFKLYKIHKKY